MTKNKDLLDERLERLLTDTLEELGEYITRDVRVVLLCVDGKHESKMLLTIADVKGKHKSIPITLTLTFGDLAYLDLGSEAEAVVQEVVSDARTKQSPAS